MPFPVGTLYPGPTVYPGSTQQATGVSYGTVRTGTSLSGKATKTKGVTGTVATSATLRGTVVSTSVVHLRRLGSHTVTVMWVVRPNGEVRSRVLGAFTVKGRANITVASVDHTRRVLGTPRMSAWAGPLGIVHTRQMGVPEVNVRFLAPASLSR